MPFSNFCGKYVVLKDWPLLLKILGICFEFTLKKEIVTKMRKFGLKKNVGHFTCVFFSYVSLSFTFDFF